VSIDLFETTGSSPPEGAIAVAELESQEPALEAEAPEVGFEAPRLRHRLTPPPPAQCVRIVRAKYPEALVCMGCGTLLASEAKSYARSGLTEEQRLSYVCGECRWAAQEAARIKALRAEQGRVNMARLNAVRGATAGRVRGPLPATKDSAHFQYRFSASFQPLARHRKTGGRPRIGHAIQRLHRREAQRLRRAAQKLELAHA